MYIKDKKIFSAFSILQIFSSCKEKNSTSTSTQTINYTKETNIQDDNQNDKNDNDDNKSNESKPPVGLSNIGNSCFMNSDLQFLAVYFEKNPHIFKKQTREEWEKKEGKNFKDKDKGYANYLKNYEKCPFVKKLPSILEKMNKGEDITKEELEELRNLLAEKFPENNKRSQEDAAEGMRYFLENAKKKINTSSKVICKECNNSFENIEYNNELLLPIVESKGDKIKIEDCLNEFFKTEKLEGENQYSCEECKKKTDAEKELSFKNLPKNIIFTLKRFEYNSKGEICKIETKINFEKQLEIEDENKNKGKYKPISFTVHIGSTTNSGHYVCYVKIGEQWYKCDDATVTKLTEDEIFEEIKNAYVVLYDKIKNGK